MLYVRSNLSPGVGTIASCHSTHEHPASAEPGARSSTAATTAAIVRLIVAPLLVPKLYPRYRHACTPRGYFLP